jgi:hypothetical protein
MRSRDLKTDVAATDGHEIAACEEEQEIGRSHIEQMGFFPDGLTAYDHAAFRRVLGSACHG